MTIDYSEFLHPASDERIWWRLEDAIKLAAGYLPVRDDQTHLVRVLRAPNNRVRANERTLIGAFGDDRLSIPRPQIVVREDVRIVEAHKFIEWLSEYIIGTQCGIAFPRDLAQALSAAGTAEHPPIGLQAWLSNRAWAAADAKHSKPGGSREKQELIKAIWAKGNYSSRDRCAEAECARLGISFFTAREALRNTPKPKT